MSNPTRYIPIVYTLGLLSIHSKSYRQRYSVFLRLTPIMTESNQDLQWDFASAQTVGDTIRISPPVEVS